MELVKVAHKVIKAHDRLEGSHEALAQTIEADESLINTARFVGNYIFVSLNTLRWEAAELRWLAAVNEREELHGPLNFSTFFTADHAKELIEARTNLTQMTTGRGL